MKKKLHVCMLLPVLITQNGTAKQCLELSKSLVEEGYTITILTCIYIPETADIGYKKFKVKSILPFPSILIRMFNINIFFIETIMLYIALLNTPLFHIIIRRNKFDILHGHDWMTMWIQSGIKSSSTRKITTINDVPPRLSKSLFTRFKLFIDRHAGTTIDAITVLDKRNYSLVTSWLKKDTSKIHIIRSGVDRKKYLEFIPTKDIRKELGISPNSIISIGANILSPHRRYEDILSALSVLNKKSYDLVFILLSNLNADLKYANKLKKLINTLEINHKVYIINRFVNDNDRMEYISAADMLVFPNSPQTWGLTVLESLALGTPVIVSRGSGVAEVLHDKIDALLYDGGNIEQLSNAIIYYIRSENRKKNIANKGKDYVLSTFTWKSYAQAMETLYT